MNTFVNRAPSGGESQQDVDVLIVGAGISGIGAAVHLQDKCPGTTYAIVERRERIGGTWDLFRYPGIRSDSDMHTLGYNFKPWTEAKAIADGPSIRRYVRETAAEHGVESHIHFGHEVTAASWDSASATWCVSARTSAGEVQFKANFLFMCSGYYDYDNAYLPEEWNLTDYEGTVVHPQHWPQDLDYSGKRVLVIGSGATAMTLVPAMADKAAHVTMLQRSPTYVVSRPAQDKIANLLRRILPDRWAYALTRLKNTEMQNYFYNKTRTEPEKVRESLLGMVRKGLKDGYDVEKHFTPSYNPWDQRLCLIPDNDLYAALNESKASVVTDQIERFTAQGVELKSGETLDADIIVTATGLNLLMLGGARFTVDGESVDVSKRFTYKGMMFSDVPNMVQSFGYINASWTLRADITCEYVCRLINHMRKTGKRVCVPRLREEDAQMPSRDWITDFSAGYMRRSMHEMPRQGDRDPWVNTQDYRRDKKMIRKAPLEDGVLRFEVAAVASTDAAGLPDQVSAG